MESGRQSDREETATMVDETCADVNVLRKRPMNMVLEPCAHAHSVHEVCGVTMPLDYEKSVRATGGVVHTTRRAHGSCHCLGAKLLKK